MKALKALFITGVGAVALAGQIRSATTATTAVSMSLSSFCLMAVTSSAVTLTVSDPPSPGEIPTNPTNSSTYAQYSSTVAAGVTRRLTAAWAVGNAAPTSCSLLLTATPASGQGSSAGQITVSTTAQNIITGIGGCATGTGASSGANLAYTLSIGTMTSLVANESKASTITFTLTDS